MEPSVQLSAQGRAVLQALAAADDGCLETAEVRRRVQRPRDLRGRDPRERLAHVASAVDGGPRRARG